MATERESTTTLPTAVQSTSAAPVPAGDYLLCLNRAPLHDTLIPYAALSEKLDELDRMSGDALMFRDARARLNTVKRINWLGDAYQIDGATVRPDPKRTG
ncbi:MAG: hypothetical protein OHK0022_21800 [Roseiflexaceae bacterium]